VSGSLHQARPLSHVLVGFGPLFGCIAFEWMQWTAIPAIRKICRRIINYTSGTHLHCQTLLKGAHTGNQLSVWTRLLLMRVALEEYEDFRAWVLHGSALLFPTQNALGVDELKEAAEFEVMNLIVLVWKVDESKEKVTLRIHG